MTKSELQSLTSEVYKNTKSFDKKSDEFYSVLVEFCKKPTENNYNNVLVKIDDILDVIQNIQFFMAKIV